MFIEGLKEDAKTIPRLYKLLNNITITEAQANNPKEIAKALKKSQRSFVIVDGKKELYTFTKGGAQYGKITKLTGNAFEIFSSQFGGTTRKTYLGQELLDQYSFVTDKEVERVRTLAYKTGDVEPGTKVLPRLTNTLMLGKGVSANNNAMVDDLPQGKKIKEMQFLDRERKLTKLQEKAESAARLPKNPTPPQKANPDIISDKIKENTIKPGTNIADRDWDFDDPEDFQKGRHEQKVVNLTPEQQKKFNADLEAQEVENAKASAAAREARQKIQDEDPIFGKQAQAESTNKYKLDSRGKVNWSSQKYTSGEIQEGFKNKKDLTKPVSKSQYIWRAKHGHPMNWENPAEEKTFRNTFNLREPDYYRQQEVSDEAKRTASQTTAKDADKIKSNKPDKDWYQKLQQQHFDDFKKKGLFGSLNMVVNEDGSVSNVNDPEKAKQIRDNKLPADTKRTPLSDEEKIKMNRNPSQVAKDSYAHTLDDWREKEGQRKSAEAEQRRHPRQPAPASNLKGLNTAAGADKVDVELARKYLTPDKQPNTTQGTTKGDDFVNKRSNINTTTKKGLVGKAGRFIKGGIYGHLAIAPLTALHKTWEADRSGAFSDDLVDISDLSSSFLNEARSAGSYEPTTGLPERDAGQPEQDTSIADTYKKMSADGSYTGTIEQFTDQVNNPDKYRNNRSSMHWTPKGDQGLDTRDFLIDKQMSNQGFLQDQYTGRQGTNPSQFDIDHIVPFNQYKRENPWINELPLESQLQIYNNMYNLQISSRHHNRDEKGGMPYEQYRGMVSDNPNYQQGMDEGVEKFRRYLRERKHHKDYYDKYGN